MTKRNLRSAKKKSDAAELSVNNNDPPVSESSISEDLSADVLESIFDDEEEKTENIKANKNELTAAEKARCERNRQKALLLRQSRLSNQQLHGDVKKTVGCSR